MKVIDIGLNIFEPGGELEAFIIVKDDGGTETMRKLSDFLDLSAPAKQEQ